MRGRSPAAPPARGGGAAPRPARQGASARQLRWRDRLLAGFAQHREVAAQSLARLCAAPVQALATMLVIAIALALPTALYLAVASAQRLAGGLDTGNRMTLYLDPEAAAEAVAELRTRLAGLEAVAGTTYVSPEQGLAEFKRHSGFGDALDLLERNPLPPVVLVELRGAPEPGALGELAREVATWAPVADLQLDTRWLARMRAIAELGRQLALALAAALALGVLLIIGNTIRLAIENHREEVLVLKLVGATDAFARRPFLYLGSWYGCGGGVLAWLLVAGARWWLHHPIERLAALYQAQWSLAPLDGMALLVLAGGGGALGALGARFAAGRQIKAIEP
ncbi:MAG: permease-like cell division protein FtsX [Pseudomonadota bacterium]|jgi:cell division transport system permease protein